MAVDEQEEQDLILPYTRDDDYEPNDFSHKAKKLLRKLKEKTDQSIDEREEKRKVKPPKLETEEDKKKKYKNDMQQAKDMLGDLIGEKPEDNVKIVKPEPAKKEKQKKEKPADDNIGKAKQLLELHKKQKEKDLTVKQRLEQEQSLLIEDEPTKPLPELKPTLKEPKQKEPELVKPEPVKSLPPMKPQLYEPEFKQKPSLLQRARHFIKEVALERGQPHKAMFTEPKTPAPSGPERILRLDGEKFKAPEPVKKEAKGFFKPKKKEPELISPEKPEPEKEKPKAEPKPMPAPAPVKEEKAEEHITEGPEFNIDLRPKLIELPEMKDMKNLNIKYPLIAPYAYAHIFWDDESNELVYFVEEPELTDKDKELLTTIKKGIEEMLTVSFTKLSPSKLIKYIEENVKALLEELAVPVPKETYLKLMYYVYRDFIGLNEIEPLLRDYYIEDIECNGMGYPIYIVHRKYENIRTNIIYQDMEALADFVEKLAQKTGRYVSYANPLLDGALPDGSRVNATYTKDITTRGPTFTIRKFTKEPWTAIHLIGYGTASPEMMAYLWIAIQHRFNVMVIGETASGKTTFLNTIVHFIPPKSRIVSIEDTRELNLAHSNWLPSVSRAGFGMPTLAGGERYGEVSLFDLLKETFRQNPDYVIVGEARGAEASVLFQGMASGHPSFSTFH
ncbi:Flp pilus assembly complex ATPase component TadA, partial [Candidatus Woesearchaeota archaeon]|nr:Flp pilus assembly complex ATPase component TadA [Candidatus Woesearchaeota archaeon]